MTTFTATADPQGRFVTLVVADVAADAVLSITRDPSVGGVAVRGTPVLIATGGATVLTDVEFPFGAPLTYTAVLRDPDTNTTVETFTATAGPVALDVDGMVVSDPLTNRQVTLTVIDQRDETSDSRHYRYDLAGRGVPLFLLEQHAGWTWRNEWLTVTLTDRAVLDELLRSATPVLLRVTSGCDLRQGWAVAGQITVNRFTIPASDTRRRWDVELSEVDPTDSTAEFVAVTLTDLHEWEPTTLQGIADRTPQTLLDLSLAVVRA